MFFKFLVLCFSFTQLLIAQPGYISLLWDRNPDTGEVWSTVVKYRVKMIEENSQNTRISKTFHIPQTTVNVIPSFKTKVKTGYTYYFTVCAMNSFGILSEESGVCVYMNKPVNTVSTIIPGQEPVQRTGKSAEENQQSSVNLIADLYQQWLVPQEIVNSSNFKIQISTNLTDWIEINPQYVIKKGENITVRHPIEAGVNSLFLRMAY
jgi:hypothetical protein